jgi:hypothetical protein
MGVRHGDLKLFLNQPGVTHFRKTLKMSSRTINIVLSSSLFLLLLSHTDDIRSRYVYARIRRRARTRELFDVGDFNALPSSSSSSLAAAAASARGKHERPGERVIYIYIHILLKEREYGLRRRRHDTPPEPRNWLYIECI